MSRQEAFAVVGRRAWCAVAAVGLVLAIQPAAVIAHAEPQDGETIRVLLPNGWSMPVLVRRPSGRGPFRLAIVSHGTSSNAEIRSQQEQPRFPVLAAWLRARGYVVAIPQRPGHGAAGGHYVEDYGSCADPQYRRAGAAVAASIVAVMDSLLALPWIRRDGVLLIGHSAGGWGSLAAAGDNPAAIAAVVNFAGGLGGRSYGIPDRNCEPARLVRTAAEFGRASRVPTLWLYTANDTYFGADLSAGMAEAYRLAGGQVEYHLLASMGDDGHFLVHRDEGVPAWSAIVERFLDRSMPRGRR